MATRFSTIGNILYQATLGRRFPAMARKVLRRISGAPGHPRGHRQWAETNATDLDEVMNGLDASLWRESLLTADRIRADAERTLSQYPFTLGGGACHPLIYFVTRMLKPAVSVETGVAAGFSSYATLMGLEANSSGLLFSSDLPYFRLPHPEQYVGILVPLDLRSRWHLSIEGDRRNIPKIIEQVSCIDFIHYDSDKSYLERKWTMEQLMPMANDGCVVIMDDVQDDSYFAELVSGLSDWHVFRFEGKYVGVMGLGELAVPRSGATARRPCGPLS
jgi:predicted O-methyltransferase YrrM